MSYRLMFIINAIVAVVFGAALLLMPKNLFLFFGVSDALGTVAILVISRFLGGALAVTGALLWFLKDINENVQKTEAATMMVAAIGGFILTVMGMSVNPVIRSNGWILLTIYVILAAGYAFLVFGLTVKEQKN